MDFTGIVFKILSNFYYIKIDNNIYECKAKGRFKNNGTDILVGDKVEIDILNDDRKTGNIVNVLPRKNRLLRPSVANVDKLVITLSIKEPKPDLLLLDKQIVYCLSSNIIPIICITKIDKDKNNEGEKLKELYQKIGYKVFLTSSEKNIGLNEIKSELNNCLCVLSGNSGIGKSTLVNLICGKKVMQEGEISSKIKRGKQTTKHVELFYLDNFLIADSPGFSIFEIDNIPKKELIVYFEEFLPYFEKCEYRNCMHINEENCGIKEAVKNGEISEQRYQRYLAILKTLK